MAVGGTLFGQGNPLSKTIWAKKLLKYVMENVIFMAHGMAGVGAKNFIVVETRLKTEKGQKITFGCRYPLTQVGQGDNGEMEKNFEPLYIGNFSLFVHERSHSTRPEGKMEMQRTQIDIADEQDEAIGDWYVHAVEDDITAMLCGLYNCDSSIETVNEQYPSSSRIVYLGQNSSKTLKLPAMQTDAGLSAETATDVLFGTRVINYLKLLCKTAVPKIEGIRVPGYGNDLYAIIASPYMLDALHNEVGENGWERLVADAHVRGPKNPLFTGSVLMYDGVLLYEADKMPVRTGAGGSLPAEGFLLAAGLATTTDAVASGKSVGRGVIMGRGAGGFGIAQAPKVYRKMVDMGRIPQTGADMIYGTKAIRLNRFDPSDDSNTGQEDYGKIVFDCQVQLPG